MSDPSSEVGVEEEVGGEAVVEAETELSFGGGEKVTPGRALRAEANGRARSANETCMMGCVGSDDTGKRVLIRFSSER